MSALLYFSLWDSWSLRWPSQLLSREASPGLLQLSSLFTLLQPDPPYSMFRKRCNSFHFSFWPVVVPSPSQAPWRSPLSAHSLLSSVMALIWVCPWAVRQGRHLSANNNHTCSFPWLQLRPPHAAIKHMPAHTHTFTRMDISHSSGTEMTCFHLSYLIGSVYSTGFFDLATMCCFISTIDLKNRAILINRCFASLRNVGLLHVCLCSNIVGDGHCGHFVLYSGLVVHLCWFLIVRLFTYRMRPIDVFGHCITSQFFSVLRPFTCTPYFKGVMKLQ